MKRSKSIRLVLLGSAGIALAACEEGPPTDARFFSSVEECSTVLSESACRESFAESEKKFAEEAPRYTRQEECEAEFGEGNCETQQTAGGGSIFLPMMMGYMMGRAFAQPVMRGADGAAVTRSGGRFYNVGTFAGNGRSANFTRQPATQVSRGGFGTTSTAQRSTTAGG